jgi:hypothetical protein
MWRVSYCLYGLVYTSEVYSSLQGCIDEIHRHWSYFGFDAMEWFKIEEKYDGLWHQRGFTKMGE